MNGKSSLIRERQLRGEQFGTASARFWQIAAVLARTGSLDHPMRSPMKMLIMVAGPMEFPDPGSAGRERQLQAICCARLAGARWSVSARQADDPFVYTGR